MAFDRLRRAFALVLGDRSLLEQVTVLALLSFSSLAWVLLFHASLFLSGFTSLGSFVVC